MLASLVLLATLIPSTTRDSQQDYLGRIARAAWDHCAVRAAPPAPPPPPPHDWAREIRVRFTTISEYIEYRMEILQSGRLLFSTRGRDHWAYLVPDLLAIVSGDGSSGSLSLRSISGHLFWRKTTDFKHELESYVDAVVCGGTLILVGRGPTYGVSIYQIEMWRDSLTRQKVNAYDIPSGRLLWRSTLGKFGRPLWSNGKVVLTSTYDVSDAALRRYKRRGVPIPVFLEQWSVAPCRRLWRKRMPGELPPFIGAVPAGQRSVILRFGREKTVEYEGLEYSRPLNRLRVAVPLRLGGSSGRNMPVLFTKERIY